jgi:hypothetical protein
MTVGQFDDPDGGPALIVDVDISGQIECDAGACE